MSLDSLMSGDKTGKVFGEVYNGRYHMPLLPGEPGTKSCPTWVPRGKRRTTNVVGAFEDTQALGRWQLEQALIGLVRQPSLYEELCLLVHQGDLNGTDWRDLGNAEHRATREALSGTWKDQDSCIAGRARQAAGANEARQAGTNRHTAWQVRGESGALMGTPEIQRQVLELEELLDANDLERVPGLQERTIRNDVIDCAGRFDDILLDRRTGELLMADLKTKRKKFFTWNAVDAQLAIYANAEWMLRLDGEGYEPGPLGNVHPGKGVVLQVPSDGSPAFLRKADLHRGWRLAQMCRDILIERAYGKSVERHALAAWPGEDLPPVESVELTAE